MTHDRSQDRDRLHPLSSEAEQRLDASLASVREALTGLQFGSITLTVHEGRVVQIDVTEKKRLNLL